MKEVITITRKGIVKRTPLEDYRLQRRGGQGTIGIKLGIDDRIVEVLVTSEDTKEIIVASASGIALKVDISDIRSSGRNTSGVRLMKLSENDEIVSAALV